MLANYIKPILLLFKQSLPKYNEKFSPEIM